MPRRLAPHTRLGSWPFPEPFATCRPEFCTLDEPGGLGIGRWLYIMSASNGWHKIGMADCPQWRRTFVSGNCARIRPIMIARAIQAPDRVIALAEYISHKRMTQWHGKEPVKGKEWFDASFRLCSKVVVDAVSDAYARLAEVNTDIWYGQDGKRYAHGMW